ncbi:MAG TPA: YceH family protein [Bryobacteraceae bacterium]|nr:YceH family protein [Bryobacteraceae bacterium]
MDLQLNAAEVRVLGSLVEKETATPDYYPLSLNALCAACNQKSSREPVMSLDENTVAAAVDSLRAKGLVLVTSGMEHRVRKYSHRLGEVFNFDRREQTLLCVLMLRGPQTAGELRSRSERMHNFDDLADVEAALARLAERTPPLVERLPRNAGEKEPRFMHLLGGEIERAHPAAPVRESNTPPLEERVVKLEADLAELKRQFEQFRKSFE